MTVALKVQDKAVSAHAANTAADKDLLKRFSLFGPPGMVFFDSVAANRVVHKVVGYQNASDFLTSLSHAAIH